ncbi:hypothetical protein [Actinocrispum sp. NPDC049592]|uniref:hypothetical protein n=1 Tax=Actinocrispum sp. NPDC049592 TaxID=3154835 RepID=UPI0034150D06
MRIVAAVLAGLLLLAGCSSTVAGTASVGTAPASTRTPTTTAATTQPAKTSATTSAKPSLNPPPTSIDESAQLQYCDQRITGALGKPMNVVVVETPAGRITCDQAGAVLVDYYTQRPDPKPGSAPVEVAGFSCNQVPEPDFPQVICADGASLFYSMWPQGG